MQINSDFSRSVHVSGTDHQWIASPQAGVERVLLDRVGTEVARATSLVRYAAGSSFPRHTHDGGEEILVLDGVFSDDSGDYPAGWYLRNPPGSSHRPHSHGGALILVKLRQMHPARQGLVRIDTHAPQAWQARAGYALCPLYDHPTEQVALVRLELDTLLPVETRQGAELLVVSGTLHDGTRPYPACSWLRTAAGDSCAVRSLSAGTTVYRKTGHLGAALWSK